MLRTTINCDFYRNMDRVILKSMVKCKDCKGSGTAISMHGNHPCIFCDGTGREPIPWTEITKSRRLLTVRSGNI